MKRLLISLLLMPLALSAQADPVLRQATASQAVMIGPFVDSTDGNTAETALTIDAADVRISINGANIVGKNSGGCTHDELGYYTCTFDATDTATVGRMQVMVHEAGALPVYHEFQVATAAMFDACCGSSGAPLTATDVWAAGTRTLTAATNITSTGGTIPMVSSRVDATVGAYQSGLAPLQPTVAGRTLDVTTTGEAGIDWANIGAPTTSVTLSGTTIGTATALTNLPTIPTAWITANGIATDAIGAAEIAADAGTELGTATWATTTRTLTAGTNINGSTFTSIPWNASWDVEVQSEANDALIANFLDRIFAADYDPAAKPGVSTALFNELIESNAGVSRFTAGALAQAPAGGGGSTNVTTIEGVDATDQIQAAAAAAVATYDPPTRAELTSDTNSVLTAVGDVPTNAEMTTLLSAADDATLAAISSLNNVSIAQIRDLVVEDQGTGASIGCVNAVALAVLAGRSTVSNNTVTYRDPSNGEVRAVVTFDSAGNRSAASITCPTY